MTERRCANCPPTPAQPVLPPVSDLAVQDGKTLWHHAALTCHTAIELMHVYTLLGVPGGDPGHLRRMASRFLEVAKASEVNNANQRTA
jgi:hypothetical protein